MFFFCCALCPAKESQNGESVQSSSTSISTKHFPLSSYPERFQFNFIFQTGLHVSLEIDVSEMLPEIIRTSTKKKYQFNPMGITYTYEEVKQILSIAIQEQESQLREEYNQILSEKLHGLKLFFRNYFAFHPSDGFSFSCFRAI